MKHFFDQKWWKWTGLVICLYAFTVGLTRPLKPGIINVNPARAATGEQVNLSIFGYNTRFDEPGHDLRVYLKLDSVYALEASSYDIIGRKQINVIFDLPESIPGNSESARATLVIWDPIDGYMVTPMAMSISGDGSGAGNIAGWNDEIVIENAAWTFRFPFRGILYETIRNTFFHVAIWFAMFFLLIVSLVYSIRYLSFRRLDDDAMASSFAFVAIVFGIIGIVTGSVWAKNTWGAYWTNDPKLNMSAVALMIYMAYGILRSSLTGDDRRAQVSAAYNIFAFVALIPLVFIIPRMTSSLHPGNGGNPALGGEDLDNTLRLVFYPSIIGLIMLGSWISSVLYRMRNIELTLLENDLTNT